MIGIVVIKKDLAEFHPHLLTRLDNNDLSGFIADLLQSLYEAEAQLESIRNQVIIDQEQLKIEKEKLSREKIAILEEKDRLVKFQSFIMKLANQIEESRQSKFSSDHTMSKQKAVS